jgi:VWFA-related protein
VLYGGFRLFTSLAIVLGGLAVSPGRPLLSQAAAPGHDANQVFQANARIVVLDVVVTGKNHRPLTDLRQQDFVVSEDGTPQTVKNFEEHTASQGAQASAPELGPNLFTNIPRVKPVDSVTVLVMDSLNTPLDDQRRVRDQVLKYLKKPQAGQKIAIFTLQTQLRLIQSFSDDPELLAAAVKDKKNGVGEQVSQLLQSNGETAAAQETAAAMREFHSEEAAEALEQFMAGQASVRSEARLKITLQALQELAHYLGGFSGRKNVVWFSDGFPLSIFPDSSLSDEFSAQRNDEEEVRKTDALLAAAQMAIYPVGAEGVSADSPYDAGADSRTVTPTQLSRPQDSHQEQNASHAGMDLIAKDTGGAAFYGTNDLADALHRVVAHGSNFYTLTYTSTNPASDGKFRKIAVTLGRSGYQLDYRRGYYADSAKAPASPAPTQSADMLSPYLRREAPESTEIPLTLRVMRGKIPPGASVVSPAGSPPHPSAMAGDNAEMREAVNRYAVDLMMPAHGLQIETATNGHRYIRMEAGLFITDRAGAPLNWLLRQVNLNLDDARYELVQKNGVNLYFEIDAPAGAVFLRGGVYDRNSHLAGTVAVPLGAVVSSSVTASSR